MGDFQLNKKQQQLGSFFTRNQMLALDILNVNV